MIQRINITPVAKPRMTRSDKWKKRPCVVEYWEYKDKLRKATIMLPQFYELNFILPMPPSWRKKKREALDGGPHTQTPDIDNLIKGFFDCLFDDDSGIWTCAASKWWGKDGAIIIRDISMPRFPH